MLLICVVIYSENLIVRYYLKNIFEWLPNILIFNDSSNMIIPIKKQEKKQVKENEGKGKSSRGRRCVDVGEPPRRQLACRSCSSSAKTLARGEHVTHTSSFTSSLSFFLQKPIAFSLQKHFHFTPQNPPTRKIKEKERKIKRKNLNPSPPIFLSPSKIKYIPVLYQETVVLWKCWRRGEIQMLLGGSGGVAADDSVVRICWW